MGVEVSIGGRPGGQLDASYDSLASDRLKSHTHHRSAENNPTTSERLFEERMAMIKKECQQF